MKTQSTNIKTKFKMTRDPELPTRIGLEQVNETESKGAGHTPGPWTFHYAKGYGFEIMLPNGEKIGDAVTRGNGESESNARLMAHAPEMLALLQDIETWFDLNLMRGKINACTSNRDGDLFTQIQNLTTKATATS